VHGPVIDLFECSDKLYTAVEVTAGNQLFNVVVDTDATASRLYALLSQHKAGRVTCLPINRLNVRDWRPCSWCSSGNVLMPCLGAVVASIALLSSATAIGR
jgi:chromosome segregation ATPase